MRGSWALVVCVACGRVAFDPLDDAGNTMGTDATDAPQTFCASIQPPPAFCADFESGPPEMGFTSTVLNNGGAVALGDVAHSGAPSLDSRYDPAGMQGIYSEAVVRYAATGTWSQLQLDYEVYPVTRPTSGGHVELCNLTVVVSGTGTFYQDLNMVNSGADNFLEELSAGTFMSSNTALAQPVSVGGWHHVRMTIDMVARTHQYEIDGTIASSGATAFPIAPGTVAFEAGINYGINSASPSQLYVDDIVLRLQP